MIFKTMIFVSPNEQIAIDSTLTVSGLAMGTDYHFLYKVIVVLNILRVIK